MKNYLFILGNAPELAEEELAAIWPNYEISGGLVKVAEIFEGSIVDKLVENKKLGERIIFGISGDQDDSKKIKRELEDLGFKARFVLPKDRVELSSVVVKKQNVTEIYKIGKLTAKTVWVQDFDDWGKRDYGRPAVDPHVGMLPPKVARMMVNIAQAKTVLDPFCGVGTTLAEALTIGIKAVGSDVNPRQIEKTKKNLDWLGKACPIFVADARKITLDPVDAIVTEPDLGPAAGLEELYLNCLAHWKTILKPGGRVVMATPFPIDKQKLMGYILLGGPYMYFRPRAKVKRYIWLIQKLQE